jgi:hypothetical protein
MDREELTALRDAIGVMLAWPDAVRDQIAAWLKPEASARPNGLDPHPPPAATPNGRDPHPPVQIPKVSVFARDAHPPPASPARAAPIPRSAKAKAKAKAKAARPAKPTPAQPAEQRLLTAMREHSGASVNALAKAAGANRSSTGERLRGLAARGMVTKDSAGHWQLVAELAGETAGPTQPPSS